MAMVTVKEYIIDEITGKRSIHYLPKAFIKGLEIEGLRVEDLIEQLSVTNRNWSRLNNPYSLSTILMYGFKWGSTPQGRESWDRLHAYCLDKDLELTKSQHNELMKEIDRYATK